MLRMFRRYKGEPGIYVIRYRNGRVREHGEGISFWYWRPVTSIAEIPVGTREVPFALKEATASFQPVTIEGVVSYHVARPLELARRLDYTIEHRRRRRYRSDDPERLGQRVVNAVQAHTRSGLSAMSLEEALTHAKELAGQVLEAVRREPELEALGVSVDSLHFSAVTASAEMQKALEAGYRERLKREADRAIYERRAAAVAEERKIRQSELETEIELEERRRTLVRTQAQNKLELAEAEARADELKLRPYGELPPQALIGLALKDFAGAGGSIGSLTITPDLLGQLVAWLGRREGDGREAA